MKARHTAPWLVCSGLLGLTAGSASAAPKLRVQVDQRGDFALIGNTLGQDCRPGTPPPIAGTVGSCGTAYVDSAPDVFWRSDSPTDGKAEANLMITAETARSTAVLNLPPGAHVTHAFVYWAAENKGKADTEAELHHQSGFDGMITAVDSIETVVNKGRPDESHNYQAVADITSIVQKYGPGAYRVGAVDAVNLPNLDDDVAFVAWWMVVLYERDGDPPRNLAVFDGLDRVSAGYSQEVHLSGFKVPNAGFDAKLGIIAFEGDNSNTGDSVFFNPTNPAKPDPAEAVSDALNPADNFFNSTRSTLGKAVSVEGDLPQLTGAPQSMSGFDLDIIDVSKKLKAGDTQATIVATSAQELFYLGGWVTSISTFGPDFSASNKVANDLNGPPAFRGDAVEYRITVKNTGNDASINTVVTDQLPEGVTYTPGSLEIVDGDHAGRETDAAGDDLAEYDAKTRTITFRVGAGADAKKGGSIAVGASSTVRFEVTVDESASDVISNQAKISAAGALGAPQHEDVTDGNGSGDGAPPTEIRIAADKFYGAGGGVFGGCSTSRGAGDGSAVGLAAVALASALRRRRR